MRVLFGLVIALTVFAAHAGNAQPLSNDPVVEQRLLSIAEELRCLVCQNESLAGSRADLAQDLRREIRELIVQGESDAEIMDFLVSRYGDFIRYRPPMKPTTWLLWTGPYVLLMAGLVGLVCLVHKRRSLAMTLSPEQQRQAAVLLSGGRE